MIELGIDVESLEGDRRRRETWVAAIRKLEAIKREEHKAAEASFDYSPKTKIAVLLRNSVLSVALKVCHTTTRTSDRSIGPH